MGKKEGAVKSAAVIDIGSGEIRLKIAQSGKGGIKVLDTASYPLGLGRETFTVGRISFSKADKACDIIRQYMKLAQEYGTDAVRVIATSAIREATNREYVLEQIRLRTSAMVDIIDSQAEKAYLYKMMLGAADAESTRSALMVHIGSGTMGVSVVENGRVPYNRNVRLGSLRISELFEDMQEYSREFQLVVEEYLRSFTDAIEPFLPNAIKSFIATGNEISLIGDLCGAETRGRVLYVKQEAFDKLYSDIKYKSVNRLMEDYGLTQEKAELLLPAMCLYDGLFAHTQADTIAAPVISLSDALLFEMLDPAGFHSLSAVLDESTLLSCHAIAQKFECRRDHYETVLHLAIKIFDKMKKLHGLGARERLLLQCAAILHDCGKFINSHAHYQHSYNIIQGVDIVGLDLREIEIVASAALYHSRIVPAPTHENYQNLTRTERVTVSKLSAILRLADALDRGHAQKVREFEVKLSDGALVITASSTRNMELEEWSFHEKSKFFEDVYGIEAIIKTKRINQ